MRMPKRSVHVIVWAAVLAFILLCWWRSRCDREAAHVIDQPSPTPDAGIASAMLTEGVERDLRELQQRVGLFLTSVKEPYRPPLGINEDVAKALTGGNRYGEVVLPTNHPSLNDRGQLVDRWGTPYHFHPRAANVIDIRSAGPDRILFTDDDLLSTPWLH